MGGGTMRIDLPTIHIKHSSSSSSSKLPVSSSYVATVKPSCSATYCFCGSESCRKLELAYGKEDKRARITSSQPEFQWLQQILDCCVTRKLLTYGQRRVYEAFQLLQTDPCVKRLVVSLSSDKALWEAVTNNELVKKLQEPIFPGLPQSENEEPELSTRIMRWIMDVTKAKIMELIETFQSLVNEMFLPPETPPSENPTTDDEDQFEAKVRSSLLLSVVILLIVVVTRFHKA
ncbi:hypothetical protein GBA52_007745 [Prunus armeniaca]|nr:hypothetical protein GBA52_007745 [Prunus armeniaca]